MSGRFLKVAGVLVASISLLAASLPASAAPPDGRPSGDLEDGPSVISLEEKQTPSSGVTATAVEYSPAGCEGQTDNAHPSTTTGYRNTVNVKGHTWDCNYTVGVYVEIKLQRRRWYGWETTKTESRSLSSATGVTQNAGKSCSTTAYQYRGRSYHESYEPSGTYSATTCGSASAKIKMSGSNCVYE
jgi:hypothetical protein